jgi:hypothetical protein
MMFVLQYSNSSIVIEEFFFPTKALALWKKKQLINQGTHKMGVFNIKQL